MKNFKIMAVAGIAALTLSACGGGSSDEGAFEAKDAEKATQKDLWTEDDAEVTSAPAEVTEDAVEVTAAPTEIAEEETVEVPAEVYLTNTSELNDGVLAAVSNGVGCEGVRWDEQFDENSVAEIGFCGDGDNDIMVISTLNTGSNINNATQLLTNIMIEAGGDEMPEAYTAYVEPYYAFMATNEKDANRAADAARDYLNQNTVEDEHEAVPDGTWKQEAPAEFISALPALNDAECASLWEASYGGPEATTPFAEPFLSDFNADDYGVTHENMVEWFLMHNYNTCPM